MTQYLTKEEYRALGGSIPESVADPVLNQYLILASIKLNAVTANRIVVANLTTYQEELLKVATQIEADYLYSVKQQGFGGDVASWSVTDISISYQAPASATEKWYKDNDIDLTAVSIMNSSGLMWRGGV